MYSDFIHTYILHIYKIIYIYKIRLALIDTTVESLGTGFFKL